MNTTMKLADVKWSTYINFNVENNEKDPKFKVCDHVRISKHKNIFANGFLQIGPKKFF